MNEKVTVEFTPLQAVILWRLFNQDKRTSEELLKTEQFQYILNGKYADSRHDSISRIKKEASTELRINRFFYIFDNALASMKINPKTYGQPDPIKIGDHEVKFGDCGISVGCRFVSNEQLKEIMERQKISIDKDDVKF